MSRYRILAVFVWLWASLWVAVSASSQPSTEVGEAHSTVLRLLEPELRNEALVEIISWPKNLLRAASYSLQDQEVVDVIVCPQRDGSPLYAVLTNPGGQVRRITLLDGDGAIIPFYRSFNVTHDRFEDVNGDGLVELVGSLPILKNVGDEKIYMEALFVLPVTRENRPLLTVLYNAQLPPRSSLPRWTWRLRETMAPGVVAIELGPQLSRDGQVKAQATYTWSVDDQRFVGPPGGHDLPFLLVEGDDSGEMDSFARSAYERDSRQVEEVVEKVVEEEVDAEGPVHVGGAVKPPVYIETPSPEYTKEARKKRIQGVVIVQVVIDREGNVQNLLVLKGLPHGLTEAAVAAVKRWKFQPATLNGNPVRVYYTLTVNFRL